jgi:hypothetical protein
MQNRFTFIYTSLLFTLATVGIALQIRWNEIVVIDNHSVPSAEFLINNVGSHLNLAKTSMFALRPPFLVFIPSNHMLRFIVMNLLSDGMLVRLFIYTKVTRG